MNYGYPTLPGSRQETVSGYALHFIQGVALDRIADAVRRRGGDDGKLRLRSVAEFDEAIAERPGLWQAFEKKGEVLEKLGRFEEAAAAYRRAWAFTEGDGALRARLARAESKARPSASASFYRALYKRLDEVFAQRKSRPAFNVA